MTKSSCVRFCLFVAWNFRIVAFLPIFVFELLLFHWSLSCLCHFFALFYVDFEFSYRCIDAIFNAGKSSSSSFFSWHWCHLWDVRPHASSVVFFPDQFVEFLLFFTSRIVASIWPRVRYIFVLRHSSSPCDFFSNLFIHIAFLLYSVRSHILLQN